MKSFATIKNVVFATLLRIETSANLFTELCYGAILSLMINVGRSAVCLFVRFLFLVMLRLKRQ